MKLTLTRTHYDEEYTTGVLMKGKELLAHTLEPRRRELRHEAKVAGRTAIPEGEYDIELSFSQKFKRMMPYVVGVPEFTGVMLHMGNKVEDTQGCILVGERSGNNRLKNSRQCFDNVLKRIEEAMDTGEAIKLEIN